VSVGAIVAIAVGVLAILAAVGRLLWATHKGLNLFQKLIDRVDKVEKALNNGIRSDIKVAADRSGRAEVLAADAARTASVTQQSQEEISRAVNALRGEVDIYTNVVLSDRQRIRQALREAGYDLDSLEE
jgi:hypothetical protein